MKRKQGHILTAVLVDYDNIYLALRRKSEEAAKRFAKDAGSWLKEVELGSLITPTNSHFSEQPRRIVLNRCYGNPVPRRNTHDNSTDMNSFPFVRHHFLRSGFEVVDCPPLTAQLKNSSDIRMVMDVRDFLLHDTYFGEFIILSGDADFTPVLHRLRAHARRTVIFANDHTAVPYKAISDGEIRESDLIAQLLGNRLAKDEAPAVVAAPAPAPLRIEDHRRAIVDEAMAAISASRHPIPLDILADRMVRMLGQDVTAGSQWGGAGSFRDLLATTLPEGIRMSEKPPFYILDTRRLPSESARLPETSPQQPLQVAEQPATLTAPLSAPEQLPLIAEPAAAPTTQSAGSFQAQPEQPQQDPITATPPQQPSPAASFDFSFLRSPLPLMPSQAEMTATRAPRIETQMPSQPMAQPQLQIQQPQVQQPLSMQPMQPAQAAPFNIPPPPMAVAPQQQAQETGIPVQQTAARMPQQSELRPQPTLAAAPPAPRQQAPVAQQPVTPPAFRPAPDASTANALQQSIARIHEACQAPPLSPPEYRTLFDVMAREISERGLAGSQTLTNIVLRAQEQAVDVRRDDVRFVLEVVSETDPWFEQGASPSLFAGRFRNFVVARCRSQGLNLSVDELDLIEAWFVSGAPANAPATRQMPQQTEVAAQQRSLPPSFGQMFASAPVPSPLGAPAEEEFPRIVRTRLRG